jgi:hypothetical protein
MKNWVVWFVTIGLLVALSPLISAQTQPTTQPMVAESLPPGWEEIDQRLVFFTIQLASVETSLDAVDKGLKEAGYHQSAKQNEAQRYEQGNETMDRNAGGPVSWQDFYGKTARRFFYHPNLDITVTKVNARDLRNSSPDNLSQLNLPGPASQRPPQFNYIYRANQNAQRRAEADVAALGGKINALVARRRQLEAEQAGIWAKIAFQAVASRRFTFQPLYRFDVTIDGTDDASKQRREAIHDGTEFVRLAVQAVLDAENVVDKDPTATFDSLHQVIDAADADLNAHLTRLPTLALDSGDPGTSLGRLVASVDRLNEVTRNISDSYHSALEGDQAGDDQEKQTFRAYAQQALFDCATNIYATTECMSALSQEWKTGIDVQHPIAPPAPTAVAAVTTNSVKPTSVEQQNSSETKANIVLAKDFVRSSPHMLREGADRYSNLTYVEPADNPAWAEWEFKTSPGDYFLQVLYTAGERRPCRLSINGTQQDQRILTDVTGGWTEGGLKWFCYGPFHFSNDTNVVRIERVGSTPHIKAIALTANMTPPTLNQP